MEKPSTQTSVRSLRVSSFFLVQRLTGPVSPPAYSAHLARLSWRKLSSWRAVGLIALHAEPCHLLKITITDTTAALSVAYFHSPLSFCFLQRHSCHPLPPLSPLQPLFYCTTTVPPTYPLLAVSLYISLC